MDNAELKEALTNRRPVVHMTVDGCPEYDAIYERVSAIIYRMIDGRLTVLAELSDKHGHSVTIVKAEKVKYKED